MNLRWIIILTLALLGKVQAANSLEMVPLKIDLTDKARLQRGAKLFMNYCSGCHSLKYLRYNRMAKDLGITEFDGEIDKDLLFSNLVFTKAKIQDPIQIALPLTDAQQWFGITPPDLTLVARKRGPKWIFAYLKSFYEDKSRPFSTNNLLIPNVAMPNILEPLIGRVIAVKQNDSQGVAQISYLLTVEPGTMTVQQFDSAMEDLVNFLTYVAEPSKPLRMHLGVWVLIYLSIFLLVVFKLKKLYWQKLKPKKF